MAVLDIFDRHYKKLVFLPLALLVISAAILASNMSKYGSVLERDVELVGGKTINVEVVNADIEGIKNSVPNSVVRMTRGVANVVIVEIPVDADEKAAFESIKAEADVVGEPTYRTVGPAIGDLFFQQAQIALVAAFVLMSIAVFIIFRSPVPSSIVVLAAATDIIATMAVMSAIGMKLSLPVLAALLTLIGYSVDTDILLTANMLRGKGEIKHRIRNAMKTGLTLTATMLVAFIALYFVTGSFVIEQISAVIIIGLVIDVFATWLTNAGILRYWMEKKHAHA
ncbi:MAG: protein translocase subunit SecF [Candidatus Aenigmarchaeota archaeon]|nr:protein translocase subunit SecF [Candidatus Aenigmarchaeota archaeon]